MSDDWCPRQIVFMLPGVPGVQVTATEVDGTVEFIIDVLDSKLSTGDLRALFFHINEDELPGLAVTSDSPYLTERRIGANAILDLDDGANLAGIVKKGFDVGIEWGTPGGKKDDISFPVSFTLSNTTGDLTLDDLGGLLFGAKLDSVGGKGGPRGSTSKLIAFAPFAPDAVNDAYNIHEDGVPDANTPSKNPQEVVLNVLANDTDQDTPHDQLVITGIHEGPSHGSVRIADGVIYYTPKLDYSGTDSFWYCVSDGTGNQDSAMVTVNISAVADDPVLSWTVAQGSNINEMIVTVTAIQNDNDLSEFVDLIDWSAAALPAGVTVTPLNANPGDQPDKIVQAFTITTPEHTDIDFDLLFTATSAEESNGDTESAQVTVPIEIDFTHSFTNLAFSTDQQSIWGSGSGEPFHEEPFIGLENLPLNFNPPLIPVSLIPPAAIDLETSGSLTFGFDTLIHLDAGHISADLNVTTVVNTTYNKTTDTLLFDPSYILNGGTFDSTGPNGEVKVDFVFDANGNVEVSLEPLDFLTGWANADFPFDEQVVESILDVSTGDFSESWDLFPGVVTLTLSWPDTSINSGSLTDSTSDHFLELNVDVDAAAIQFFPILAPLDPVITSEDDLELLAIDITGFLDLI
jgi:Bacterial Ig domain